MKTRISRVIEWDMGHRLQNHESLCANPHGHRYTAEVVIEGPVIEDLQSPQNGMITDFGELKDALQERIIKKLDHSFMVQESDPLAAYLAQFARRIFPAAKILEVPFAPTAENIASWIFNRIQEPWNVVEVTVWETPNCKATVTA